MTIKYLLPLIATTLLCSGTVLVDASQAKNSVSPTKPKVTQSQKPVATKQPKVTQSQKPVATKKPKVIQSQKLVATKKPKVIQPVQPKWKLFTAPDKRFTVLMPGTPVKNTQVQKTYMGAINLNSFVAQPPKQEVVYLVTYNDFPYSYGQLTNPQELLNNARDLALKTTQSNLIRQRNLQSSNGHPGKEIEYVNSGGKITRSRMYVAEGRLYQVTAITSKKQYKALAKTITGYLNSFQVVLKS